MTVDTEAPSRSTEVFHNTWNEPILIAPIASNQGKSLRFTRNNDGLNIASPTNRVEKVDRSRQNARLTAFMSEFRTVRLINIPDVDQNMVARITNAIPLALAVTGLDVVVIMSFYLSFGVKDMPST